MTETILTGLRANNDLQLGNYFGALLPLIDLAKKHADEYQINLFVPDLHSFTTPIDHGQLQDQIKNNLKIFVAAGLPVEHPNVHMYRQSRIAAHSELAWIIECFTGFGELSRMTEFKDKSSRLGEEHIGVGQFNYPALMAADILLYNAAYVPVGEDQRQHIEFTRMIAERMNNKFGELFTIPASMKDQASFFGNKDGKSLRIMDLHDPTKKMSKSDATGKGNIFLSEDPARAAKKIKSATTDNLGSITYDREQQPGVTNLLQILSLVTAKPLNEVIDQYHGQEMYGSFKADVAEAVQDFLTDFQAKFQDVDEDALKAKLVQSETKLTETANETLHRVQKAVGLR